MAGAGGDLVLVNDHDFASGQGRHARFGPQRGGEAVAEAHLHVGQRDGRLDPAPQIRNGAPVRRQRVPPAVAAMDQAVPVALGRAAFRLGGCGDLNR